MGNLNWRQSQIVPQEVSPVRVFNVQQPWFGEIAAKRKTVEVRVGSLVKFASLKGQTVEFKFENRVLRAVVDDIVHYDTLAALIDGETWEKIAPQSDDRDSALANYLSVMDQDGKYVFDGIRILEQGGVVALRITVQSPPVQATATAPVIISAPMTLIATSPIIVSTSAPVLVSKMSDVDALMQEKMVGSTGDKVGARFD